MSADPGSERKHSFVAGGLPKEPRHESSMELCEFLLSQGSSDTPSFVIVEDRENEVGSKFLKSHRYVHSGKDIFLLFELTATSKPGDLLKVMRSGTRYPFISGLISGSSLGLEVEVSDPEVSQWSGATSLLVVGAYDEESYLLSRLSVK
jgi:hypothetical protein